MLIVMGVLYLPLHFIILLSLSLLLLSSLLSLLLLLLFLISFLLFLLLLEFLSIAVSCSYKVSWPFGFASFNFFNLNLIHATTIWCWHTTSILSFGIILLRWHECKGHIVDVIWAILCLRVSLVIIERWGKVFF